MTSTVPDTRPSSVPGGLTCVVSQICSFGDAGVCAVIDATAYSRARSFFTAACQRRSENSPMPQRLRGFHPTVPAGALRGWQRRRR